MYTLYTIPGSCSTGIAVLMKKLGVEFKSVKRDDVQNYTDIVPTNQVPAIVTPTGTVITEGAAIAMYLLEKYGQSDLPQDIESRAEFYQWLNFDYATLHPAYSKIFSIYFNETLSDDVKGNLVKSFADKLSDTWSILDKRLANQKYILGDTPTHVDYMAAIYTSWNKAYFDDVKIELGENVKRFVKDVQSLPEFQAGYEADNVEFKLAA